MGNQFDKLSKSLAIGVSRRRFLKGGVGAAGILAGASLWTPARAMEGGDDPNPIPTGLPGPNGLLHVYLPGPGHEPSTITDFNGFVGQANVKGQGTASDGTRLFYDVDNRFMVGDYVGVDGRNHYGSFAMI